MIFHRLTTFICVCFVLASCEREPLHGVVTTDDGAPVGGAEVVLTALLNYEFRRTTTLVDGTFVLPRLDVPGELSVSAKGYGVLRTPVEPNRSGQGLRISIGKENRFAGLGIELDSDDTHIYVSGVVACGPAAASTIRVGDKLKSINGTALTSSERPIAEKLIRGESGRLVTLVLEDDLSKQVKKIDLRRSQIRVPCLSAR